MSIVKPNVLKKLSTRGTRVPSKTFKTRIVTFPSQYLENNKQRLYKANRASMVDKYEDISKKLTCIKVGIADMMFNYTHLLTSGDAMKLSGQISAIGHAAREIKRTNNMLREYPIIL